MPYEDLVHLFDYDRTEALDYREIGMVDMGDAQVRDISYASPNGGQVSAFLVTPPGNGLFAAIVFLHRGGSNRRYFLDEALKYAKMGAVSLLLDDNFSAIGKTRDRDRIIQIVNDVRRGLQRAESLRWQRERTPKRAC